MTGQQTELEMDNDALESAIEMAALRMMTAPTVQRRRDAYDEIRSLIKRRVAAPAQQQGSEDGVPA